MAKVSLELKRRNNNKEYLQLQNQRILNNFRLYPHSQKQDIIRKMVHIGSWFYDALLWESEHMVDFSLSLCFSVFFFFKLEKIEASEERNATKGTVSKCCAMFVNLGWSSIKEEGRNIWV